MGVVFVTGLMFVLGAWFGFIVAAVLFLDRK